MATSAPFLWKNTLNLPTALLPQEMITELKKTGLNIDSMGIAIVNLNGPLMAYTPSISNFSETRYAASLVKIAAMYVAFYLQNRLQTIQSTLGNISLTEIESKLSKEWRHTINLTLPISVGDFPKLDKIFASTMFDFKADFYNDMELMIKKSDNSAAARCIEKLRFDYLNGALCYSGFYSKEKTKGLWLSGNFAGLLGKQPPGAFKSNMTASAEAVSLFLVNLAKDQLISPSASKKMKELMKNADSEIYYQIEELHNNATVYGKIGVGEPKNINYAHDCAIVKYNDMHYVAVYLFGENFGSYNYKYHSLIARLDLIARSIFKVYNNSLIKLFWKN